MPNVAPNVVVSLITPFAPGGELDEVLLRAQLRRMAAAGVAVNVAGSGAGEAFTFTPEERERVLAIAVEELSGKVQVRALGCEPRTAADMIAFLRAAERAKVDAAQVFSLDIGNGIKPVKSEMRAYYDSVLPSTSLPVYLSSHQVAGYLLPLDLVEDLAERHTNIAGIGYGGSDAVYLAELIARVGGRIQVHVAGPGQALTALVLGAHGFMGAEGNFAPSLAAQVVSRFAAGDLAGLKTAYGRLMALHALIHRVGGGSMRGVKPLMNALGLPGGTLRPPRLPITDKELAEAVATARALELTL